MRTCAKTPEQLEQSFVGSAAIACSLAWALFAVASGFTAGCTHGSERARAEAASQSASATAPAAPSPNGGSGAAPDPSIASPAAASLLPPALEGGGASAVRGEYGMVTSVERHATLAGVSVLEAGGNAVDAAVAVGYALAVTHPSAGNIGGGGFMLVALRGQKAVAIDFRETAPLKLTQRFFDRMIEQGARGPAAIGVPGTVAGLNLALQMFGTLPLERVLEPAIRLARGGYELGERQAKTIEWAWHELQLDSEAKSIFGSGGKPKPRGQRLVQPELAATLERISASGTAGFYAGRTAELLLRATTAQGILSAEDLTRYRAVVREPLELTYRGYRVGIMPPPSAGGATVAMMLSALEKLGAPSPPQGSAPALHLFLEVAKRAHAERRFRVVDPDSVDGYDELARRKRWYDASTVLDKRPPILPDRATPARELDPLFEAASRELEHTTHFSIVDRSGNVVSCTVTQSASFGARFVAKGTGVVLNNTLAAFGTVGEDVPKPGRRMTSSMAPTLVFRGDEPVLVLGTPGGDTIPNTIVQVLRNVIDYRMTIDRAVLAPRVHHGFVPDEVRVERAFPLGSATEQALERLGHHIATRRAIGAANNILLRDGIAWAIADPREGGLALGPSGPSEAH